MRMATNSRINPDFRNWLVSLTDEKRKQNFNRVYRALLRAGKEEEFLRCVRQLTRDCRVVLTPLSQDHSSLDYSHRPITTEGDTTFSSSENSDSEGWKILDEYEDNDPQEIGNNNGEKGDVSSKEGPHESNMLFDDRLSFMEDKNYSNVTHYGSGISSVKEVKPSASQQSQTEGGKSLAGPPNFPSCNSRVTEKVNTLSQLMPRDNSENNSFNNKNNCLTNITQAQPDTEKFTSRNKEVSKTGFEERKCVLKPNQNGSNNDIQEISDTDLRLNPTISLCRGCKRYKCNKLNKPKQKSKELKKMRKREREQEKVKLKCAMSKKRLKIIKRTLRDQITRHSVQTSTKEDPFTKEETEMVGNWWRRYSTTYTNNKISPYFYFPQENTSYDSGSWFDIPDEDGTENNESPIEQLVNKFTNLTNDEFSIHELTSTESESEDQAHDQVDDKNCCSLKKFSLKSNTIPKLKYLAKKSLNCFFIKSESSERCQNISTSTQVCYSPKELPPLPPPLPSEPPPCLPPLPPTPPHPTSLYLQIPLPSLPPPPPPSPPSPPPLPPPPPPQPSSLLPHSAPLATLPSYLPPSPPHSPPPSALPSLEKRNQTLPSSEDKKETKSCSLRSKRLIHPTRRHSHPQAANKTSFLQFSTFSSKRPKLPSQPIPSLPLTPPPPSTPVKRPPLSFLPQRSTPRTSFSPPSLRSPSPSLLITSSLRPLSPVSESPSPPSPVRITSTPSSPSLVSLETSCILSSSQEGTLVPPLIGSCSSEASSLPHLLGSSQVLSPSCGLNCSTLKRPSSPNIVGLILPETETLLTLPQHQTSLAKNSPAHEDSQQEPMFELASAPQSPTVILPLSVQLQSNQPSASAQDKCKPTNELLSGPTLDEIKNIHGFSEESAKEEVISKNRKTFSLRNIFLNNRLPEGSSSLLKQKYARPRGSTQRMLTLRKSFSNSFPLFSKKLVGKQGRNRKIKNIKVKHSPLSSKYKDSCNKQSLKVIPIIKKKELLREKYRSKVISCRDTKSKEDSSNKIDMSSKNEESQVLTLLDCSNEMEENMSSSIPAKPSTVEIKKTSNGVGSHTILVCNNQTNAKAIPIIMASANTFTEEIKYFEGTNTHSLQSNEVTNAEESSIYVEESYVVKREDDKKLYQGETLTEARALLNSLEHQRKEQEGNTVAERIDENSNPNTDLCLADGYNVSTRNEGVVIDSSSENKYLLANCSQEPITLANNDLFSRVLPDVGNSPEVITDDSKTANFKQFVDETVPGDPIACKYIENEDNIVISFEPLSTRVNSTSNPAKIPVKQAATLLDDLQLSSSDEESDNEGYERPRIINGFGDPLILHRDCNTVLNNNRNLQIPRLLNQDRITDENEPIVGDEHLSKFYLQRSIDEFKYTAASSSVQSFDRNNTSSSVTTSSSLPINHNIWEKKSFSRKDSSECDNSSMRPDKLKKTKNKMNGPKSRKNKKPLALDSGKDSAARQILPSTRIETKVHDFVTNNPNIKDRKKPLKISRSGPSKKRRIEAGNRTPNLNLKIVKSSTMYENNNNNKEMEEKSKNNISLKKSVKTSDKTQSSEHTDSTSTKNTPEFEVSGKYNENVKTQKIRKERSKSDSITRDDTKAGPSLYKPSIIRKRLTNEMDQVFSIGTKGNYDQSSVANSSYSVVPHDHKLILKRNLSYPGSSGEFSKVSETKGNSVLEPILEEMNKLRRPPIKPTNMQKKYTESRSKPSDRRESSLSDENKDSTLQKPIIPDTSSSVKMGENKKTEGNEKHLKQHQSKNHNMVEWKLVKIDENILSGVCQKPESYVKLHIEKQCNLESKKGHQIKAGKSTTYVPNQYRSSVLNTSDYSSNTSADCTSRPSVSEKYTEKDNLRVRNNHCKLLSMPNISEEFREDVKIHEIHTSIEKSFIGEENYHNRNSKKSSTSLEPPKVKGLSANSTMPRITVSIPLDLIDISKINASSSLKAVADCSHVTIPMSESYQKALVTPNPGGLKEVTGKKECNKSRFYNVENSSVKEDKKRKHVREEVAVKKYNIYSKRKKVSHQGIPVDIEYSSSKKHELPNANVKSDQDKKKNLANLNDPKTVSTKKQQISTNTCTSIASNLFAVAFDKEDKPSFKVFVKQGDLPAAATTIQVTDTKVAIKNQLHTVVTAPQPHIPETLYEVQADIQQSQNKYINHNPADQCHSTNQSQNTSHSQSSITTISSPPKKERSKSRQLSKHVDCGLGIISAKENNRPRQQENASGNKLVTNPPSLLSRKHTFETLPSHTPTAMSRNQSVVSSCQQPLKIPCAGVSNSVSFDFTATQSKNKLIVPLTKKDQPGGISANSNHPLLHIPLLNNNNNIGDFTSSTIEISNSGLLDSKSPALSPSSRDSHKSSTSSQVREMSGSSPDKTCFEFTVQNSFGEDNALLRSSILPDLKPSESVTSESTSCSSTNYNECGSSVIDNKAITNLQAQSAPEKSELTKKETTIRVKHPSLLTISPNECGQLPASSTEISKRRSSNNSEYTWYRTPDVCQPETSNLPTIDSKPLSPNNSEDITMDMLRSDQTKRHQFHKMFETLIRSGKNEFERLSDIVDCTELDYKSREGLIVCAKKLSSPDVVETEVKRARKEFDSKLLEREINFRKTFTEFLLVFTQVKDKRALFLAIYFCLYQKVCSLYDNKIDLKTYLLNLLKNWLSTDDSKHIFLQNESSFLDDFRIIEQMFIENMRYSSNEYQHTRSTVSSPLIETEITIQPKNSAASQGFFGDVICNSNLSVITNTTKTSPDMINTIADNSLIPMPPLICASSVGVESKTKTALTPNSHFPKEPQNITNRKQMGSLEIVNIESLCSNTKNTRENSSYDKSLGLQQGNNPINSVTQSVNLSLSVESNVKSLRRSSLQSSGHHSVCNTSKSYETNSIITGRAGNSSFINYSNNNYSNLKSQELSFDSKMDRKQCEESLRPQKTTERPSYDGWPILTNDPQTNPSPINVYKLPVLSNELSLTFQQTTDQTVPNFQTTFVPTHQYRNSVLSKQKSPAVQSINIPSNQYSNQANEVNFTNEINCAANVVSHQLASPQNVPNQFIDSAESTSNIIPSTDLQNHYNQYQNQLGYNVSMQCDQGRTIKKSRVSLQNMNIPERCPLTMSKKHTQPSHTPVTLTPSDQILYQHVNKFSNQELTKINFIEPWCQFVPSQNQHSNQNSLQKGNQSLHEIRSVNFHTSNPEHQLEQNNLQIINPKRQPSQNTSLSGTIGNQSVIQRKPSQEDPSMSLGYPMGSFSVQPSSYQVQDNSPSTYNTSKSLYTENSVQQNQNFQQANAIVRSTQPTCSVTSHCLDSTPRTEKGLDGTFYIPDIDITLEDFEKLQNIVDNNTEIQNWYRDIEKDTSWSTNQNTSLGNKINILRNNLELPLIGSQSRNNVEMMKTQISSDLDILNPVYYETTNHLSTFNPLQCDLGEIKFPEGVITFKELEMEILMKIEYMKGGNERRNLQERLCFNNVELTALQWGVFLHWFKEMIETHGLKKEYCTSFPHKTADGRLFLQEELKSLSRGISKLAINKIRERLKAQKSASQTQNVFSQPSISASADHISTIIGPSTNEVTSVDEVNRLKRLIIKDLESGLNGFKVLNEWAKRSKEAERAVRELMQISARHGKLKDRW